MWRFAILILMAAGLSGCGSIGGLSSIFGGPQPGLSSLAVKSDGSMSFDSGKEYQSIKGEFTRPDGMGGKFEAQGVNATAMLQIQAEAAKANAQTMQILLEQLLPLIKAGAAVALKGVGVP